MKASWTGTIVGSIIGSLVGVTSTAVVLAVTAQGETIQVRVDDLKEVVGRMSLQVEKLSDTVLELSKVVAKLEK